MNGSRQDLDLLVVGDANPDLVLRGDVVPRFGQAEQLLGAADLVLAGSAGIVAAGAARLGVRTALAAHVGCDLFGDFVLDQLRRREVDVSLVTREPATATGLSVILSTPGDRAILTLPGTIPLQRAAALDDAVLARARHVHLAGLFLNPHLADDAGTLFERAHAAGATTSLDTNGDPSQRWNGVREILTHTDVFLPNVAELLAIADCGDDLDAAAARIRTIGPTLAVKAGPDGALGWDGDGRHSAPPLPVEVVDTTGAGDSFVAAFLAARLAGRPFTDCLRRAAIAGSLSTRAPGGTAAQPTPAELERALPPLGDHAEVR